MRHSIAKVALVAVLAGMAAAPAFGRLPAEQGYQAKFLRAQALNAIYGLGHPVTVSHVEYRAELIRATGMNQRYGLPTLGPDEIVRLFGTGLHESGAAPSDTNPPPAAHRPGPQL